MMPRNPAVRPRLTRPLTVRMERDEDSNVTGDLRLKGFVVLESIELNSVTFADRTSWSPSSSDGCRVAPDLLMLVGGL